MTKEQLVQYLRVCTDLADKPGDGIAHVGVAHLRQIIGLLDAVPSKPTSDRLSELESAGSTGADLSPGDPLCAWAAEEIRRLRAAVAVERATVEPPAEPAKRDTMRESIASQIEAGVSHNHGPKSFK